MNENILKIIANLDTTSEIVKSHILVWIESIVESGKFDGVNLDVRKTKDNKFIITNLDVEKYTLKELVENKVQLPFLEDVLVTLTQIAQNNQVLLNIPCKENCQEFINSLMYFFQNIPGFEKLLFYSDNWDFLRDLKKSLPLVPLGALIQREGLVTPNIQILQLPVDMFVFPFDLVDYDTIKSLFEAGKQISIRALTQHEFDLAKGKLRDLRDKILFITNPGNVASGYKS